MADCELLNTCPFFNDRITGDFPVAVETMKMQFCRGNKALCARYKVFAALGREKVPGDLIPVDSSRARRILAGGGDDLKGESAGGK